MQRQHAAQSASQFTGIKTRKTDSDSLLGSKGAIAPENQSQPCMRQFCGWRRAFFGELRAADLQWYGICVFLLYLFYICIPRLLRLTSIRHASKLPLTLLWANHERAAWLDWSRTGQLSLFKHTYETVF